MKRIWVIASILTFALAKDALANSLSLQLIGRVPVSANVEVHQDPNTKKLTVKKTGSPLVRVETEKRQPASVVRVVAP